MAEPWTLPGCPAPPHWKVDPGELLRTFPWLRPLADCPQDPAFHAEGDVWTHVQMVLRELAALPTFRALPDEERNVLFAAGLLHDICKPDTTREENGRIRSPGHAVRGVYKARRLLTDDPHFTPHGTPFRVREDICGLVRWHGLPVTYVDKPDPTRAVLRARVACRFDLLTIFAEADHRGRICTAPEDTLARIQMFPDFCREVGCWDTPFAFPNAHTRFEYFRTETAHPTLHLFDDTVCEVTMMCGLPGSGKSSWIAEHRPDTPVVSLDDIRDELDVTPTDDQAAVIALAYERAREHFRRGQGFVWNATSISRMIRGKLIDLATGYKARLRVVYVEPPIPVIRRQNRERVKVVPESVWERMFSRLDVPTEAEAHAVEYVVPG
jgi:predicted kinase